MDPVMGNNSLPVWTTRIAGKQQPRMRIREDGAVETLVERRLIENSCLKIFGVRRYVGLPAQTRNHGQMGIRLPGILEVRANVTFTGVPPNKSLLLELRRFSQQKVTQRQSGVLRIEREFTCSRCARQIIGCGMDV